MRARFPQRRLNVGTVFSREGSALLLLCLASACSGRKEVGSAAPSSPEPTLAPAPSAGPRVPPSTAARPADVTASGTADGAVPRIGTCAPEEASRKTARITIAHFNDLQARYSDRIAGKSRYAYLAGYLRKLKTDVPATLVLDAGDDYEKGAIAELRSNGETTRQMIQALPIDVRTIGNHDFAYGEAAVLRDVRASKHPVLAANVKQLTAKPDEQPFRAFVRVDVGCVRVGIIGLVTQNYGADDRHTKEPFDGVFAQDEHYADILRRELKDHRAEVDVMIALNHLGYAEDSMLATGVGRGLDLIVGAHTEDLLRSPAFVKHPDGTRTYVVQAGHYGETLGRAELVVDLREKSVSISSYRIVDVDASLPVADDVDALAKTLEAGVVPDARSVVGKLREPIKRGKAMADLVHRAASSEWESDALVIGRDLFWQGLPRGEVDLQRMYEAVIVQRQPAGSSGLSSLWTFEVAGDELARLKQRFRPGPAYEMYVPPRIDPAKRYRVTIDKRALAYPGALFGKDVRLPQATLRGEIIDLLERHAKARTAAGLTLD